MFTEECVKAVETLRRGGVLLYPTDTVWGLGCDATDPVAVARIFRIKKRSDRKAQGLIAREMDKKARYVKEMRGRAV